MDKPYDGRLSPRIVIPAKTGIRKGHGCPIRSGMTNLVYLIAGLILVLGFVFSGCREKPESKGSESEKAEIEIGASKTIVGLGDSLTAGLGVDESWAYPAQLERRLVSDGYNIKVVNAGISGETSSGTLSRMDWVITSLKPDYVILVIGANDGMRGIDTGLLRKNLDQIISILQKNHIKILFGGMEMLPNLGIRYAEEFKKVYSEIALKHNLLFIPFFLEGVAGEGRYNQNDGIHPTAEGYARIVDHIYPYVLKLVNDGSP